jgi:[acyl-carrier-protein] S-malonyltransferase
VCGCVFISRLLYYVREFPLPPGYDLLDVCVNGPAERLNLTEVSQPAIYVASLAALEKMKSTPEGAAELEAVDVCAGLSLG